MKRPPLLFGLGLAVAPLAVFAAEPGGASNSSGSTNTPPAPPSSPYSEATENEFALLGLFRSSNGLPESGRPPKLDPKRIINDSNSFLKAREPEMTAEEYALYEKVTTMLTTNPELAVKMLESMMNEKEPPSPAFEFILGNVYFSANQMDRAEEKFRGALKRYPDFIRAWNNLGILHYTRNQFASAAPCFSKAVALGDRDPATFGLLGYSLEKEGDIIAAEMAYLQAMSGDPSNVDWKEGLLRIYIAGKQYGRAEPLVRSLIKAKPAETRYWADYAGVLLAQRRKVEAMIVLEEATSAGAAGPDELQLLGDLYAEQNLSAQAVAAYRKVLAADRARGEQKLLQFARMLVASGNVAEAEKLLANLGENPTPATRLALLQARADLLVAREKWADARHEIQALLVLAPLNGEGLLTLGRTYLEEKDLAHSALAFEAASKVPESAYQASLELANIELLNRHYAKSAAHLEKALGIQRTEAVEDFLVRVKSLIPRDSN